jgi:hypothetical protein
VDVPENSATLYFPVGDYWVASQITTPDTSGWRIQGGGGVARSLTDVNGGKGAFTILRWKGGTTGPMLKIGASDGTVWECMNFDGVLGCDTVATGAGPGLDNLILFDANEAGFFHEFRNDSFFNAQRLFYCKESATAGPADLLFHKCYWNCGEGAGGPNHDQHTMWTSRGFYADENQTVNVHFYSNEWNNTGICVSAGNGGSGNAGRFVI